MTTLTLRGLEAAVAERVRARAGREGKSMNRCIVDLIEESVADNRVGKPREYDDLDHLFGSMSEEDAQALAEAVADSRTVDRELWN